MLSRFGPPVPLPGMVPQHALVAEQQTTKMAVSVASAVAAAKSAETAVAAAARAAASASAAQVEATGAQKEAAVAAQKLQAEYAAGYRAPSPPGSPGSHGDAVVARAAPLQTTAAALAYEQAAQVAACAKAMQEEKMRSATAAEKAAQAAMAMAVQTALVATEATTAVKEAAAGAAGEGIVGDGWQVRRRVLDVERSIASDARKSLDAVGSRQAAAHPPAPAASSPERSMRSAALLVERQMAANAAAQDRLPAVLPAVPMLSAACLPPVEMRVVEGREGELQEIRVHRTRTLALTLTLTVALTLTLTWGIACICSA